MNLQGRSLLKEIDFSREELLWLIDQRFSLLSELFAALP